MRGLLIACALIGCDGSGSGPIGGPSSRDASEPASDGASALDGAAPLDALDAAPAPDAARDGCPVPPQAVWSGTTRIWSGDAVSITADVTFTLASSDACIDHFVPTGTVTDGYDGPCTPSQRAGTIVVSNGELVVDRSSAPAMFTLNGYTQWDTAFRCDDGTTFPSTAGGRWVAATGLSDGVVIDGVVEPAPLGGGINAAWHLRPVGASFPPPGGCVEDASDSWHFAGWAVDPATTQGATADVTFTRTSTTGCVDHFTGTGTASAMPEDGCTINTPSAPITDGAMVVDRGVNPPTYRIRGETYWNGTKTCGGDTDPATFGGTWADEAGGYLGDHAGGGTGEASLRVEWRLSR